MEEFVFVDHLKEHIKGLVTNMIRDGKGSLPQELQSIDDDRLIFALTDGAVPILRKIEDDAIGASIARLTGLVRFSQSTK